MKEFFSFSAYAHWEVLLTCFCLIVLIVTAITIFFHLISVNALKYRLRDIMIILKRLNVECNYQHINLKSVLDDFEITRKARLDKLVERLNMPSALSQPEIFSFIVKYLAYRQKTSPKAFQVLIQLRDEMYISYINLKRSFGPYYEMLNKHESDYTLNIIGLSKMHDDLFRNMGGKSFDKTNGADWYTAYFSIFSNWFRKGGDNELTVTYPEIVLNIINLNRLFRFVPFVIQTSENAFRCQTAYEGIISVNEDLREKIKQLAFVHRKVCRVIPILLKTEVVKKHDRAFAKMNSAFPLKLFLRSGKDKAVSTQNELPERAKKIRFILRISSSLAAIVVVIVAYYAYKDEKNNIPSKSNLPISSKSVGILKSEIFEDTANFKMLFQQDTDAVANVYGIDVSRYQGNLIENYDQLDSLHFVVCKATEGSLYSDPSFSENWEFCRKKGIVRGAYHFFLSHKDPLRQAEHFIKTVKHWNDNDIPPIVDVEKGSLSLKTKISDFNANLLLFLAQIQQRTKRIPIVYCDRSFADTYLTNHSLANYPLWLAEYTASKTPKIPKIWKRDGYVIWQKRDSYKIDAQNADFDVFNGDGKKLIKFIKKSQIN